MSGIVIAVIGVIPWPSAGAERGFQAELFDFLIAPRLPAKGLAAIRRAMQRDGKVSDAGA